MQFRVYKQAGSATIIVLLTAVTAAVCGGVTDQLQSVTEQVWMEHYIPRSDEEAVPLTDYDNFEVTELFRAETTEDLESAVSDGYPMPWLEEVLKDTTIPWEDRYWLDCRVRAVIARDLQLFYERDGNPVHIDCDYLHPGEDYWRENLIVNPPPWEEFGYDTPELAGELPYMEMSSQPGYIINLYGEKVGDIAITRDRVWLSRDASVGVTRTGHTNGGITLDHACFLYPDGSFRAVEIDGVFVQFALSESGDVAVFYSRDPHSPDSREYMLYAFDSNGDLIFQRLMPTSPLSGSARPAVSPDDRYIAVGLYAGEVQLLDAATGETLHSWGGGGQENRENWVGGSQLFFTPDSRYLCTSGGVNVLDCETGQIIFRVDAAGPIVHTTETTYSTGRNTCNATSDAQIVSNIYWTDLRTINGSEPYVNTYTVELRDYEGRLLYTSLCDWRPYLSPNGVFLLGENYDSGFFGGEGSASSSTPFEVMLLGEVQ